MSASVEEAANAHSHLSPSASKTKVTPAEGYGTMKAGAWNPVSGEVVSGSFKANASMLNIRIKRRS